MVKIEEAVKAIKEQCVKVEEFVVKLNISNEPHGVITDGDLAVQWSKYWDTNCQVAKSVSDLPVAWEAGLDAVYRERLSSCP